MRRRVGITTGDILDEINSWPEDRRQQAYQAIADIEEEALAKMQVMPGAIELCDLLDKAGVPRGLVTRNVQRSVDFFHDTHFNLPPFFPALSREWTPYKPSPAAMFHIAEHWGVPAEQLAMIGDSAKDDIVCGNRAGATTILLDTHETYKGGIDDEKLSGELRPDFYAKSLQEVAQILQTQCRLEAPPKPEATLSEDAAQN